MAYLVVRVTHRELSTGWHMHILNLASQTMRHCPVSTLCPGQHGQNCLPVSHSFLSVYYSVHVLCIACNTVGLMFPTSQLAASLLLGPLLDHYLQTTIGYDTHEYSTIPFRLDWFLYRSLLQFCITFCKLAEHIEMLSSLSLLALVRIFAGQYCIL